jgi:prevent-host-death family protein
LVLNTPCPFGSRQSADIRIEIAIHYGYNRSSMKVSVAEAKNKLPKLIKAVENGESVTIYRHGTPVVDIVRTTKAHPERPTFGTLKGKVTALDHDWWKPMTNDEVEAFLDGR